MNFRSPRRTCGTGSPRCLMIRLNEKHDRRILDVLVGVGPTKATRSAQSIACLYPSAALRWGLRHRSVPPSIQSKSERRSHAAGMREDGLLVRTIQRARSIHHNARMPRGFDHSRVALAYLQVPHSRVEGIRHRRCDFAAFAATESQLRMLHRRITLNQFIYYL